MGVGWGGGEDERKCVCVYECCNENGLLSDDAAFFAQSQNSRQEFGQANWELLAQPLSNIFLALCVVTNSDFYR